LSLPTESKEDLKAAETELADLQAREQTLKDLRKQLVESEGSFNTIVSQLAGLANFWTAVSGTYLPFRDNRMLKLYSPQDQG